MDGVTGAAWGAEMPRADFAYSLSERMPAVYAPPAYATAASVLEIYSDNPARTYIRFHHNNGCVLELRR